MPPAKKPPAKKTAARKSPPRKASQSRWQRIKAAVREKLRWRKVLRFCLVAGLLCAIWGTILITVVVFYFSRDLPDTDTLKDPVVSPAIRVLAADGQLIASLGGHKGDYLTYKEVSPYLWQAVLATEDRRFFHHFGVDVMGLGRAFYENMRAGYVVQGGSTVTQQLAKISFLSSERTMKRKIQEVMLALWFEAHYSKGEILTMYLNRVYLGAGNYGVDAAARNYFGKSAKDLTLYESAIIAGLLKAPSKFSPFSNPALSASRAYQVIINMADAGYLENVPTLQAIQAVTQATENAATHDSVDNGKYFGDWIASQVAEYVTIGKNNKTITVLTTLSLDLQAQAEKILASNIATMGKDKNVSQGALVTISPDGAIRALVGGVDYHKSQYNRATQSLRQPGSSFKLFVYLAGLEHGLNPQSMFVDGPVSVAGWHPENHNNKYAGNIPMRAAFAHSSNSVAVQISESSGRRNVVEMAQRLGITSPLQALPSIALGSTEATLLEMTQAYAHIASRGKVVRAYGIDEIRDYENNLLYKRQPVDSERVLSPAVVDNMARMLQDVTAYGTGRGAAFGRPVAGKTGTSQEYKDAWFLGFTPQFVTGVWVGNDDNTSMKKITGGTIPARIFHDYMAYAHDGLPPLPIVAEQAPSTGFRLPFFGSDTQEPAPQQQQQQKQQQKKQKEGFWNNLFNF